MSVKESKLTILSENVSLKCNNEHKTECFVNNIAAPHCVYGCLKLLSNPYKTMGTNI